ncbi:uncharacterized protein LOC141629445 [Silene latifolia]|uniref:uncharacterized protein LOC141629445 n=1 Tax=Silene latifolia TaxID=37657 RepID=UPI003D787772
MKGKKKPKTVIKQHVLPIDVLEQEPPSPVTLKEFFPQDFLNKVTVCTVSATEGGDDKKKIEEGGPDDVVLAQQLHSEKENEIVAALDALPTNMGWKQIFHLPKEKRQLIIQGLEKPELYAGKMKEKIEPLEQSTGCVSCNAALSFSDEDLLLGSKPHNRPLYVQVHPGQKVKRILIDGGSGVNLMPKATMNELGITMDELSSSRTMIHGFNLNRERAVGMIRVNLTMGDLSSDTLFHVMDGKTSFKLLLGRPWKHENGVVASTLHQCLKYYRGGERKIDGDAKPFSKVDSFFADAKFFEENGTSSEFMPTTISSTGKGGKREKNIIKEDEAASPAKENDVKKDVDKVNKTATPVASPKKQETPQKTTPPVLRYIPKSRRKDGESPFAECLTPKTGPKDKNQSSSEGNKGIFDSNAYKLLAKAGYEFTNPTPLGKVIEVEPYGLNKAQHKVFKQDGSFMVTRAGLGYESPAPVKIGARRKGATASSQHITVEEVEENEGEEKMHPSSVFDRINPPPEKCRPSIFTRLGRPSASTKHISVFARLSNQGESKVKVSTPSLRINKKGAIHERLGEEVRVSDDLRSAIPSCMKRTQVVNIIQHEPLKARRRVLVLTGQQKNAEEIVPSSSRPCDTKKSSDLEITTSSYHITVEEIPDENEEVEADEASETLEDGGQSTVDELKELNLGTTEDPHPIYVSALLTKEEEEEYYKLLVKYKDVFAWSYKEMPGLSPKIAVHRLAIKKGTNPKKQPQRRFRPELVPEIEKEVNKLIEAGFIREVKYSTWIANIVPVRKKNGQLRICIDFRYLNDACPKDDFPLPVTELMIDATTGHEALSFMDYLLVLSGRLAKWAMLLKQYDLVFVPQKVVKGQAIADFFADHPIAGRVGNFEMTSQEEKFSMWTSYLHGKCTLTVFARQDGAGAGVVFVTPQNHLMPYAFTLTQLCTYNMAEYQALILGLQMAIEIGVRDMDIYGDSKLVVNQVLGEYEVKKEDLIPYHQQALQLLNQLDDIHVGHVPRSANKLADALANLAATLALGTEESMKVPVCNRWVVSSLEGEENVDTTNMICVYTVDEDD